MGLLGIDEDQFEQVWGKNNLPDILARWRSLRDVEGRAPKVGGRNAAAGGAKSALDSRPSTLDSSEAKRPRTAQSFCVPKVDLAAQGYDLSLNRYKEVVHAEVAHRPPGEILKNLAALEKEITTGMKELEDMLK